MGDYGDYSTTSYGAQGGANGGGFMPGGGSQDNPNSKRREYGKDTLRPVTIRQIINAEQIDQDSETFRVDGAECTQITFVGQIMTIAHHATNFLYKVDDGTGQIDVKVWVDQSVDPEDPKGMFGQLKEGGWVRCFGRIKTYGKRNVLAHIIRRIDDYNEREYHYLEATAVHLFFKHGPPGGAGGEGTGSGGGAAATSNGGGGAYGGGGGDDKSAMLRQVSAHARRVFECINTTPQTNEGLHMQDIALRTKMQVFEVLKAGEELVDAGLTYTTEDDHTWAVV